MLFNDTETSVIFAHSLHFALPISAHSRVMFAGQTTTGGSESLKLMVCKQLELLPQPSNAVHVRRIIPLPLQLVVPNASTKLRFVTPLQVSVALAEPVLLVVGNTAHSRVMSAGQTTTGGTLSLKLMVCKQLALFPQPSNAVQVRRIVPLPVQLVGSEECSVVRVGSSRRASFDLDEPVLLVVGKTAHSRVMSAGQRTTGGTVSLKLMG